MRKNNNVIKALSIGLSAAMLLQPMAALADEIDVVTPDNEDAKILVLENEEEKEEESYSDKLEAAEGLVDEAIKEEKEAHVEAVASVGSGVLSAEALAIIAESNAKKDVAKAEDIVEKAEEKIDDYLDDADKHTVSANDAIEAANNASVSANEAAKEAEAASVSANEAGTSGAAGEFVGVAKEQSGIADEKATEAEEKLEEANKELEDAKTAYEAAVEEAKAAVEAANSAIADGAADAEAAVTAANIALTRAEALKNATGEVLGTATGNLDKATADYNKANEDLAAATAALGSAVVKGLQATATTVETGLALAGADAALVIAKGVKDIAQKNYDAKEAYLKDLLGAKDRAEKAIADAKTELKNAKDSEKLSKEEYEKAISELNQAEAALESINGSIETAKTAVSDAAEEEAAAKEAFDAVDEKIKKDGYDKTIYDLQKELVETKAKDSEANVDELVQKLTHAVAEHEFKKADTDTVDYSNGVYVVTTEEGVKYYKSTIADDGSIELYEYVKETQYEKVVDTVSGNDIVAGDYADKKIILDTPATEAVYTVSYEKVVGTETVKKSMSGSEFKAQFADGNLPEGSVVTVTIWSGTYYYRLEGTKWQAYYDAGFNYKGSLGTLKDDDPVVLKYTKNDVETVTVPNVSESELEEYKSLPNYDAEETTPAKAAVYKVSYKETSTITKSELEKLQKEYPEGLIEWKSNEDGVAPSYTEAQEAEYTVTYLQSVTDEGGIEGNIRNRLDQTIGQNEATNQEIINGKLADGYDVVVTIDGTAYHVSGIYTKNEGPAAGYYGRAYVVLKNGGTKSFGDGNADVRVSWSKTTTEEKRIENVKESDLAQYSSDKYSFTKTKNAVEAVYNEGKEETFTVITYKYNVKDVSYVLADPDKDGEQDSIYGDYNAKNKAWEDAKTNTKSAQEKVDTLNGQADTAKANLDDANSKKDVAQKNYDEKKQAVMDAQKKYDDLKAAHDAYYGDNFVSSLTSQYAKDLVKAGEELAEAKIELESAKLLLANAKSYQAKAKAAHEEAVKNYNKAIQELAKATANELAASVKVAETGAKLAEMKTAYAVAKAADDYANGLKNSADEAYQAAVAARDALEALKNNASVKQDEIEKAEAAYNDAMDAYNKAKEEAENARAMADQAQKDYESALAAYNRLLAAEEAARNNGNDDSEVNEETIEVPVVVAPVRTATRRAVVTPVAEEEETAPEAVVEEVVIADEEVALAETPVEEEKVEEATVAIEDEDTPLATQEEKAMSWWWLLIVLVLGTTGAEMYRRHQLKKNAATVEADEK